MGIKLKKPRTCDGCKALIEMPMTEPYCQFRFETVDILNKEKLKKWGVRIWNTKPTEPCPKPKTHDEFDECIAEYGMWGEKHREPFQDSRVWK